MALDPFAFVPLPKERSHVKPRLCGFTMMIDWGLGLARQRDILEIAGQYVDLAKIATGTSRLYQEHLIGAKLELYKKHGVRPFLGGQFQEYVFATQGVGALPVFFDEAKRLGFEAIEVSDNCIPLSPAERREQIKLARGKGLTVFGEVGSKTEKNAVAELVLQARDCFDAGAELLLIEGAELIGNGTVNTELLHACRHDLEWGRVLFELPGPWISGVSLSEIHDIKKLLVREFGADVNIANVMPDDLIETEALRVGLGVVGPARKAD